MKKIKTLKGYTIVQLSEKDKADHNIIGCDYACILNDEMEFPASLRNIDMECSSEQECINFIG